MKRIGIALTITMTLGLMFGAVGVAHAASCYPDCGPTVEPTGDGTGITGGNWCPNSTVRIEVDGVFVGTAQVDKDGNFTFTFPSDISAGKHTVTVTGLRSDCVTPASRTTTVVIGAGGTAFTGSNISIGLVALVALVIVGTGALVAGRRRKLSAAE